MQGFSTGLAPVAAAALLLLPTSLREGARCPDDPARPETIERLLREADMEALYARVMDASITAQIRADASLATYEAALREFVATHASFARRKPELIHVYRETFSESEVEETIRFYQSPFGRRLMSTLPALLARPGAPGAQRVHEHLTELRRALDGRSAAPSTVA